MGVNSLPETVTRQRSGCDLNPGPTAPPESSTLTARLPSHPVYASGPHTDKRGGASVRALTRNAVTPVDPRRVAQERRATDVVVVAAATDVIFVVVPRD